MNEQQDVCGLLEQQDVEITPQYFLYLFEDFHLDLAGRVSDL